MMKLSRLPLILLSLAPSIVLGNTNDERMEKAYKDLHQRAQIQCDYYNYPVDRKIKRLGSKVVKNSHVETNYLIQGTPMTIKAEYGKISKRKSGILTTINIDGETFRSTTKKNTDINFKKLRKLNPSQEQVARKFDLRNLLCSLEMAKEDVVEITNEKLHINVHPHGNYDLDNSINSKVEEALNNSEMQQLVLLDDYRDKGNWKRFNDFLQEDEPYFNIDRARGGKIIVNIPESIPMIVSPAGHNLFNYSGEKLTVLYTGGNHNYCMWNNTKRVIDEALENINTKTIVFNYDTEAIVSQKGGIIDGLSIPRGVFRQSNRLDDIFRNMSDSQLEEYLGSYFNYFVDERSGYTAGFNRKAYYSKLTFTQNGPVKRQKTLIGTGSKEITIIMNYF